GRDAPSQLPSQHSVRSPPSSTVNAAPRPNKNIIPQEVVGATQDARKIVNDALQQAQQIREDAIAEAEATRQQGYEEGKQEGLGVYTEQTTAALLAVRQKEANLEPEFIKLVRVCVERVLGQEV